MNSSEPNRSSSSLLNLEKPHERVFKGNPLAQILSHRGKYIAACLTITRAYLAASEPNKMVPLASYEDWCRMVREPLVWLGEADPVKTVDAARDEDPELITLVAVLIEIRKAIGDDYLTVAGIKRVAEERKESDSDSTFDFGRRPYRYPELRQTLVDAASIRGEVDNRRLGWMIGALRFHVRSRSFHCWSNDSQRTGRSRSNERCDGSQPPKRRRSSITTTCTS